ncbi:unnamed protein product [Adineta steineri]|uniref:FAD-binding domain-containing protein n=1 Tax=Adineta steineri TaxID=433720 RepID=A0A813T6L9_9BILA|nr:unnamed protein product [Adineta steineri]CAF0919003.1 unnamed protein product [Adineta steineri]
MHDAKSIPTDLVDVLIVGGGIGGLVTALCLHREGYSVRVHERVAAVEPIGFGLNLQPFSVKVLYELGLEHELDEVGIRGAKALFYSRHGQLIYSEVKGIEAGYKWPTYSMHRGNFQQLLMRHVRDEVGETSVRLNQKLIAFRSYSDYVEADFVNPCTGDINTERAKLLIGADGINSTVRKILYPNEGRPLWRGSKLYRGVAETDKLYLDGRTMILMGNPNDVEFVTYPVGKNTINWACVVRVDKPDVQTTSVTPDWNNIGHSEDLLPFVSHMKLDFLDIRHLIQSSIIINEFPLTDRDPLPRWTHERVTLLGDAAHPMYPNGGNGASQAILDARELTLSFRQHGITPEGLQAYDDRRRPATNTVVLAARQYGSEEILKIVDERSSHEFSNLSDVVSTEELETIMLNFKKVTGSNIQKLNQEPSLF